MKKILIITAVIALAGLLIVSCSKDKTCKTCKLNTYVNSSMTQEGEAVEYCGSELDKIELEPPVTVGNTTTKYVCN
jgi:hypothetical protein